MYGKEWIIAKEQEDYAVKYGGNAMVDSDGNSPLSILEMAANVISSGRVDTHGNHHTSHANVASLWQAYLGQPLSSRDVALMMVLLKVARTMEGEHNPDDYVDICGYAALAQDLDDES